MEKSLVLAEKKPVSGWIVPYLILLIAGALIPSDGLHGIFNIKSVAFLVSTLFLGFYVFRKNSLSLYQFKLFTLFIGSLVMLFGWLILGMTYEQTLWENQIDQFKIFTITIAFVLSTLYWESEGLLSYQQFLKTLVYANFAYSLIKVTLVLLHLFGIINMFSLLSLTGLRFMSMSILGSLTRMQTSVDIVAPFLLFFVLQSDRWSIPFSRKFKTLYILVSLFAIFLSFSRFMLLIAFMSYMLYLFSLPLIKMAKGLLNFLIIIFAVTVAVGPENTLEMIEKRFFSKETIQSDKTRLLQIHALMEEHDKVPILGNGLGGYAKKSIRDEKLLYSYEVQWLAFLMQFGLMGTALLLIPPGFITAKYLSRPNSRIHWALFGMFLLWLLSGFTNPFLISLTSGVVYALFMLPTKILE